MSRAFARALRDCLALLTLSITQLHAAETESTVNFAPRMHRYASAEGLPSNRIWAMVQDRAGYLWVATDRGLVMFNGRDFQRPQLAGRYPELAVESLYLDSADQLWLGSSERGVCVIAADRKRHQCFSSTSASTKLPGDTIFAITELAGSIFLGVFDVGIVEIDPVQWIVKQEWPLAKADFIAAARTDEHAVFARFSGGFAYLSKAQGPNWILSESSEPAGKHASMIARQNAILIGRGGGLGAIELSWQGRSWIESSEFPVADVVLSLELLHGKPVAGSTSGLTVAQSGAPKKITATFGLSPGLPEGNITALLSDKQGGLWIGSDGDGLAYWSISEQGRDWLVRSSPGLPTALIQHAIRAADGGYWLATQNRGLLKVAENGALTTLPIARGLVNALPTASTRVLLEQTRGRESTVWIGHQLGLSSYQPSLNRFRHWQSARDSKLVDLITGDPNAGVWLVSGRDLLVHLDDGLGVRHQYGRELTGGDVEQIEWLNGDLWLAGQGGLRQFERSSTGLVMRAQPINEPVYAFAACPKELWLATANALISLELSNFKRIQEIARPQGLPSDIGGMRCSKTGQLWWAGPGGLWHLEQLSKKIKAQYFPGARVEFTDRPFEIDGAQLLIGSQSGLLRQNIDSIPVAATEDYPLHLLLDGKSAPTTPQQLPWRNPTLELQLDALNYGAAQNHYRFQLLPGPPAPLSLNPSFSLTSLAPGEYQLRASAQSASGLERFAAPLSFIVPPPPWQRWYVQLPALLCLLGLSAWLSALYLRSRAAKRIQQQRLEHAEQLDQARLESLAFISHEMRNVLNGITANAELLRQSAGSEGQEKYRTRILDSGVALTQLLDDALDHSKLQLNRLELHPQNFALAELLQSLAEEYGAKARTRELRWHAQLQVPQRCFSDSLRLRQILINLLSNAIKFTTHGGVSLIARWQQEQLLVSVQDSGPGIPLEQQAQLFTPFSRLDRREQGSGLGLALSFQLARALGGTLTLNPGYQPGCEFELQLPMPLADEIAAPARSESTTIVPGLRLLIVEDHAENRALLCELLGSVGHHVSAVSDAFAALAISSTERFDAVLIDLDLGVVSGWELAPLLAAQPGFASVPLIALSGRVEAADRAASRAAGMTAHLAKPYQLDQIQQTLLMLCPQRSENTADHPAA